jgi:L-iditol 2-dehydrogenase
MKVAVWYNNQDIRIEDVLTPQPGPTEMLVRVVACGICGSDVVDWYRRPRAPLVQGHEIGAEVVEIGQAVKKFKTGDRVFIAPKVPCLHCDYCNNGHFPVCPNVPARLPGAFAEYVLVPEAIVEKGTYLLPDAMTCDQSTLIEPLACVVRAQKLAGVQENQAVLVIGCGMSGLLHVKLAKAKHCTVIGTDLNRRRLEFAAGIDADMVIHAAEDLSARLVAGIGRKADVVMLCTAAISAVAQAWKCVDKGGTVVFFAVPGPEKEVTVPINYFWTRETKILTSYYCGPPDIADAIHLIETGTINVDDMITHRLPLSDVAKGFQLVLDGADSLKVIIRPHQR